MILGIFNGRDFYGTVGEPTGRFVDNKELCVGDIVKVKGRDGSHVDSIQPVVRRDDKLAVLGYGFIPLSELEITFIVKSHTELKEGDNLNEMQDFKIQHKRF